MKPIRFLLLVAIAVCFALGILSASLLAPVPFGLCLLLAALAAIFFAKQPPPVVVLLAIIVLLGYARTHQAAAIPDTDVSGIVNSRVSLTGLVSAVTSRSTTSKSGFHMAGVTLEVDHAGAGQNNALQPVSGRVHATLGVMRNTPHVGDTIQLTGDLERPAGVRNPGGTDYAALLATRGIYSVITVPALQAWHVVRRPQGPVTAFHAIIAALRDTMERTSDSALGEQNAAVLKGILLGDNEDIPEGLKDDFEQTGTVHILATAGLHIGIASIAIYGLLKWMGAGYRRAAVITAVVLAVYALLAGGRASVTRAVTVADVWLFALVLAREPNVWTALACAALLQLVWNPLMLYDAGFQMSFATVATIVVTMPLAAGRLEALHGRSASGSWWRRTKHWCGERLAEIIVLSLCAQIGAAPLAAYYFHTVSLASVPANVTVIPAVLMIMCIALVGAALSLLYAPLGGCVFKLAAPLLSYVGFAVHEWALAPFAAFSVKAPPWFIVIAYYLAVLATALKWQAADIRSRPGAMVK